MAHYKVLVGSHVASNDPLVVVGRGEVFESSVDVVAVFGRDKFQLVDAPAVAVEVASQEGEGKKGSKAK